MEEYINRLKTGDAPVIQRGYLAEVAKNLGVSLNDRLQDELYNSINWLDLDVIKVLIDNGADVNTKGFMGVTPLHIAASREDMEFIKVLVGKGADVNAETESYGNALLVKEGLWRGCFESLQFLVFNGANVNAKNECGETLLHKTAISNEDAGVARFLVSQGADVNAKDDNGRTPLHVVRCHAVAEFLVSKVTNVNVRDKKGNTPLHHAALRNNERIARLLVSEGADVNARNKGGNTPLHIVADDRCAEIEFVEYLISQGADVHVRNKKGRSPLDLAKNKEVMKRLKRLEPGLSFVEDDFEDICYEDVRYDDSCYEYVYCDDVCFW